MITRRSLVRAFEELTIERSVGRADSRLGRSAVAVVLSVPEDHRFDVPVEVLLTRRARTLRTHSGEVAFPGGVADPGEHFPVATALREAAEEVALDRNGVDLVGALDPLTTFTSDRVVIPVVMCTTDRPTVVASPAEVEAVLHVPFSDLLHPDCYHQELWSWRTVGAGGPVGSEGSIPGADRHPMHFFDIEGDTIWGATAAMLFQLLTVVLPQPD